MRIGSYWGIPAPVLLLAYRNDEDLLKEHINSMKVSGNGDIIRNLHKEFIMLKQLEKFLNVTFVVDTPVSEQYPNLMVVNGALLDSSINPVVLDDLKYEMLIKVVQLIYDGERKKNFIKISSDNLAAELRSSIENFIANENFEISELNKVCRKIYKTLRTPDGVSVSKNLLESFPNTQTIPNSIVLNGEQFEITPEMQKVCQYYLNKMDLVDDLIKKTEVVTEEERKIFGISFFDLLKRKPESLLYSVQNKFDYIKNKQTATAVRAVVKAVQTELNKFIESKNVYVTNSDAATDANFFNVEKAMKILATYSTDCTSFFVRLLNDGIYAEDFVESDFIMLINVYEKIKDLDYDFFCNEFKIELTEVEMEDLFYKLTYLGISGLNLYSIVLFEESIYNTTLSEIGTIVKSEEYLNTLDQILFDIQSLLKTIKPIGAMVNE